MRHTQIDAGIRAELPELQDQELERTIKRLRSENCAIDHCKEIVAATVKRSLKPGEDAAAEIYDAQRMVDRIYTQERRA